MKKLFPFLLLVTALLPPAVLFGVSPTIDPNYNLVMGSLAALLIMNSMYLYLRIAKGCFARDLIGSFAIGLTVLYILPLAFFVVGMMITEGD